MEIISNEIKNVHQRCNGSAFQPVSHVFATQYSFIIL